MKGLQRHKRFDAPAGPVVCVVMDGVGLGDGGPGDAVALAHTPTLDALRSTRAACALQAHGTAVGMPSDADMGNSEVGHNVLGAGRVFDQGAKLVANAVADGSIFEGVVWREQVAQVVGSGEALHFIGLLSDGNVHSHIDHLVAMLRRAAADGVRCLRVHALLDGRDVGARSALTYAEALERVLAESRAAGCDARVASGGGRMRITMDRYGADWGMVERGWNAHVHGQARAFASLHEAITTLYGESSLGDQDLEPFVVADQDGPVGRIRDGAAVILTNFRGDRALQISRAFEADAFNEFDRGARPDVRYAGMMEYDGDTHTPARYLVAPPAIDTPMGEWLAHAGVPQFAISETQKYGHVTYFWNGNRSGMFDAGLEHYVEIPSYSEPFSERPWMRAAAITDAVVEHLRSGAEGFVRLNYANGDMVGHTGELRATRIAVEAVDLCLARLQRVVAEREGVLVVTADHGNADAMLDGHQPPRPRTSHSLNPVPFAIFDPRGERTLAQVEGAGLHNVPGTCLDLMGFEVPDGWGRSLLAR